MGANKQMCFRWLHRGGRSVRIVWKTERPIWMFVAEQKFCEVVSQRSGAKAGTNNFHGDFFKLGKVFSSGLRIVVGGK